MGGLLNRVALPGWSGKRARSYAIFVAKAALAATILWIVLTNVGLSSLEESFSQTNALLVLAAMVIWILMTGFAAQRWRNVASAFDKALTFRTTFIYTWVGLFVNLVLPALVGLDTVRTLQMRAQQVPIGEATRIIVTDRIYSFVSLLIVIAAGIPVAASLSGSERVTQVMIIVVIFGSISFALLSKLYLLKKPLSRYPGANSIWKLSQDVHFISRNSRALLGVFVWAIGNHVGRVAAIVCLALALGIELSAVEAFALVPIASLIVLVPISLGGWGVREVVYMEIFKLAGLTATSAVSLSILWGLVSLVMALLGGGVWMMQRKRVLPGTGKPC